MSSHAMVSASQGAHIVVGRDFLPGESALMVPKTKDGRVLFAIPWHGRVVIGTTDTAMSETSLEPRPLAKEIEFLLEHAALYLARPPKESDILSTFAGLRPLVKAAAGENTASLSRDHTIVVSRSGLVTITGGKWTTYRKMGEDVVNTAAGVGDLRLASSRTAELALHAAGAAGNSQLNAESIRHYVREEMARTVEDILARRTRLLILDARAAIEAAPMVATAMAAELQRDAAWECTQVESFQALARQYLWR
jgi:glycerol-3-phosphate dehydrogenase